MGPGILYAATAIGVSHVVQSTRAGAVYGLSMILVLVVAGLTKYPAIRFASQYTAATGRALPESYLSQGWLAAAAYLSTTLFSVWFVLAAISITTAGLVATVFRIEMGPVALAGWIIAVTVALLVLGRYQWLERAGKALVLLLAVMVVIATALTVPEVDWSPGNFVLTPIDLTTLFFIVAVAGWMPTPVDGGVLVSVWTRAKMREQGIRITPQMAKLDFNAGYGTAMVLAVGFLIMGVAVMHEAGVAPDASPAGFSEQIIGLFTAAIGDWSFYLIGGAAVAALFSTLLAALDGMPRQFVAVTRHYTGAEAPAWLLKVLIVVFGLGAWLVLATMLTTFARFIDLATTIGFVMAPVYAILNHRAMLEPDVPEAYRASRRLHLWSLGGIAVLTSVSLAFFYFRLFVQ